MAQAAVTHTICSYCRQTFLADDERERFCSEKCQRLFQVKNGINTGKQFDFGKELETLQQMVLDYASKTPSDSLSGQIQFYEEVVDKTVKILTWINASSHKFEEKNLQELDGLRVKNTETQRKMDRLLEKAAELSRENKELKKRMKGISRGDLKLARTLLGISEKLDIAVIKKAYRKKAKQVHPDNKHGDADLFKAVTDAMVLLVADQKL